MGGILGFIGIAILVYLFRNVIGTLLMLLALALVFAFALSLALRF